MHEHEFIAQRSVCKRNRRWKPENSAMFSCSEHSVNTILHLLAETLDADVADELGQLTFPGLHARTMMLCHASSVDGALKWARR